LDDYAHMKAHMYTSVIVLTKTTCIELYNH